MHAGPRAVPSSKRWGRRPWSRRVRDVRPHRPRRWPRHLAAGCGADDAATPPPEAASAGQSDPGVPAEAQPLLAEYGLDGLDAVGIVDRLDRLGGADRPADLMASVRPDSLVLSSGDEEYALPIEGDRFYLSVAP